MTAPRIVIRAELRVHGREVETIVRPRWTDDQLAAASALDGREVTLTIEPANAPEVEPPHWSALDCLAELKSQLLALWDNHDEQTHEQNARTIQRCLSIAHLAILSAQRVKP